MFFSKDKNHTLVRRLVMAKGVGALFGFGGAFVLFPLFMTEPMASMLAWGIALWYLTMGLVVGLAGLLTHHPYFGFRLYPGLRGVVLGAWMNLVLGLVAYDTLEAVMSTVTFSGLHDSNILLCIVLEGAIVGGVIDFAATRFGGEGKSLL